MKNPKNDDKSENDENSKNDDKFRNFRCKDKNYKKFPKEIYIGFCIGIMKKKKKKKNLRRKDKITKNFLKEFT